MNNRTEILAKKKMELRVLQDELNTFYPRLILIQQASEVPISQYEKMMSFGHWDVLKHCANVNDWKLFNETTGVVYDAFEF